MSDPAHKVVLVTGASSGIGQHVATHLAGLGHRVYGASRSATDTGTGVVPLPMDVSEDASVTAGVAHMLDREGRIDVVVNNAGIGVAGPIEETPLEAARKQFETNFFGTLRVCHAVLPAMREAGRGLIINVSSLGGLFGLPFQGLYCASKFAVEGLTESLRMEVKRFGIHVTLINPGDLKTNFTRNREKPADAPEGTAYAEDFAHTLAVIEKDEQGGPSPAVVARLVERIMAARKPRVRYFAGHAYQKAVPYLKRWLPGTVVEKILMTYYGL